MAILNYQRVCLVHPLVFFKWGWPQCCTPGLVVTAMAWYQVISFFVMFWSPVSTTFHVPIQKTMTCLSIDWFKGKITGTSRINHGKINGFRWRLSLFCQPIEFRMIHLPVIFPKLVPYGSNRFHPKKNRWLWDHFPRGDS